MSWVAKVSIAGYTPGRRDFPELVLALNNASEQDEKPLLIALVRAKDLSVASIAGNSNKLSELAAMRACRVLGVIGGHQAIDQLVTWTKRPEEKLRQQAFIAIGKVGDRSTEAALLDAWPTTMADGTRRSLVEAMGKIGGRESLALITDLETDHEVLQQAAIRALLMLKRTESRSAAKAIATKGPVTTTAVAMTRRGLERILVGELTDVGEVSNIVESALSVRFALSGSPDALLQSRTWEHVEFEIARGPLEGPLPQAIARELDQSIARQLALAFGHDELRFRIAFENGGHRRGDVWATAEATSALAGFVNDSTAAPWILHVNDAPKGLSPHLTITLEPRDFGASRFAYRERDVPAASHPNIAAALVRTAGLQASDVVWDPFCGSGLELCERVLAGPYRRIIGSDIEERALNAARANLTAIGMRDPAELVIADALKWAPQNVTLIITNPPMGIRVARDGSIRDLLDGFIRHAARVLRPGGRMVWLNPMPQATEAAIGDSGMQRVRMAVVDMGGFDAELQVLRRPGGPQKSDRLQRNRRET